MTDRAFTERPTWIRKKVSWDSDPVREVLDDLGLKSVCVSAGCPNKSECWQKKHVTFMILGENCTRKCKFCGVNKDIPEATDPAEPGKVAEAVKKLGIKYAVITSVTRDDLIDKGAGQFVETVRRIKETAPDCLVELLIPDMSADPGLLKQIARSGADVIGHNIEIPGSLYPEARPGSDYNRSLSALTVLREYCGERIPTKSAMIIGLGETDEEIILTAADLKRSGVSILYIGQYLSPTREHWLVKKYYSPEEFSSLKDEAKKLGFKVVYAGPMVRSSYRAAEAYIQLHHVRFTIHDSRSTAL